MRYTTVCIFHRLRVLVVLLLKHASTMQSFDFAMRRVISGPSFVSLCEYILYILWSSSNLEGFKIYYRKEWKTVFTPHSFCLIEQIHLLKFVKTSRHFRKFHAGRIAAKKLFDTILTINSTLWSLNDKLQSWKGDFRAWESESHELSLLNRTESRWCKILIERWGVQHLGTTALPRNVPTNHQQLECSTKMRFLI